MTAVARAPWQIEPVALEREKTPRLELVPPAPVLPEAALYGLAGDIAREFDPYTETSKAADLITALVFFGNALNSAPHTVVNQDRHPLNLFAVLVGDTGTGRKGQSINNIRSLFRVADPGWESRCVHPGLATGEGLINMVRDARTVTRSVTGKDGTPRDEVVVDDPGVTDKRLLATATEFGGALEAMGRTNNILSMTLREAWDGNRLGSMVKKDPIVATGAHISVIGHVTGDELRKLMTDVSRANGFANRFLFAHTARTKLLPEGDRLPDHTHRALAERLSHALDFGRRVTLIERDAEAKARWRDVYGVLSTREPGLIGAITGRAEAQVLRLSAVYAVMDLSAVVKLVHLEAALALWSYCEDTARYVFARGAKSSMADKVLTVLVVADGPVSKTALHAAFHRNIDSAELDAALQELADDGRAERAESPSKPGRPVELWRSTRELVR